MVNNFVFYCNLTNNYRIFHQRESIEDFNSMSEAQLLAKIFSADAIVLICDEKNILRLQKFLQLANFCKINFGAKPKIAAVVAKKSENWEYFYKHFGDILVTEEELDSKLQEFFERCELARFWGFNLIQRAEIAKKYLKDCTQAELAKKLKMSRSSLANLVRLNNLPQSSKELLKQNIIYEGHARCLLGLSEQKQQEFADKIIREKISVRSTENIRRKYKF